MLIVLYGTSCSGKTSLARELQKIWPTPALHVEADRFVPTIAEERFQDCDEAFKVRLVLAIHQAIAAFGRSGIDAIVDGSMPGDAELRGRCISILRDAAPTTVVAVRCAVDVLRAREASRPDRVQGWAEKQSRTLYDGVDFDFTVDTTDRSPADCAAVVLRACFPPGN
jgi:chloramphenicol 3-O phosphotransferase